jgi:hypothetical protein
MKPACITKRLTTECGHMLPRPLWGAHSSCWQSACIAQEVRETLTIMVEDAAAPWSRSDGTGYANDVVVAAFKEMGVEIQLRVVPYSRCKYLVLSG